MPSLALDSTVPARAALIARALLLVPAALALACSGGGEETTNDFTAGSTDSGTSSVTTVGSMSGPVQTSAVSQGSESAGTETTAGATEVEMTEGTGNTSVGPSTGEPTTGAPTSTSDPTTGDPSTTGEPTGGVAPTVIETAPADGLSGIDYSAPIVVTFSEAMKASSLTTNTDDDSCSGSVQVSADGFTTCMQMTDPPVGSPDLTEWTLVPALLLASTASYQIRVTTDARSGDDVALAEEYTSAGFTVRYYHPIQIDGVNDFTADETFTSSTGGFTGYVAWDKAFLYLGYAGADLQDGMADQNLKWVLTYLGGANGGASGVTYNTQQPALPFAARWHVRHRLDEGLTGALEWSGNAWVDAWAIGQADVAQSSGFVELRVPLTELGDPETVELHLTMINEKGLAEWTWGAVPSGSLVDNYDPDYGGYFEFELQGSTVPADHVELP